MTDLATAPAPDQTPPAPDRFDREALITDVWYVAALARDVKPGGTHTVSVCGAPLTITRDTRGGVAGIWPDGPGDITEQEDLIWAFVPGVLTGPPGPPPVFEGPKGKVRYCADVTMEAKQDFAIYGLLDPAHTPFVHRSPFWRGSGVLKNKEKRFEPNDFGFTMTPHAPVNSDIYKIIGGAITVRIAFKLPGLRAEYISNASHSVLGLTALTPVDAHTTRLRQIFFWDSPVLAMLRPLVPFFAKPFLQQDVDIMRLCRMNDKYGARVMLVGESDRQFIWYAQVKKAWRTACETGAPFVNPLEPATLRWKT